MPELFQQSDVEQVIRLVGAATDPTVSMAIAERRLAILEGMADIVGADMWYWATFVLNPKIAGDGMVTMVLDGGWQSDEERASFFRALSDPEFRPLAARCFGAFHDRHATHSRELLPREEDRKAFDDALGRANIQNFIISQYPVSEYVSSAAAYYRRFGAAPFSERDRALVHLVFSQIDWIHREGTDVPASNLVVALSRREREVMVYLLGGDSQKQVASKMKISEHTVSDYIKAIYKYFNVSSRAELLSHFISGGRR